MSTRQRNIALLLARDLATNIATAFFLVDAEGEIVFYNERAERLVGRTFAEVGPRKIEEWGPASRPETPEGRPMGLEELPLMRALKERHPAQMRMYATMFDGERRLLTVTAFPLLASPEEVLGAAAVFWEDEGASGDA